MASNVISDKKNSLDSQQHIKKWKSKRLIQKLRTVTSKDSTLISLNIKPGQDIHRMIQFLSYEIGTTASIKSRKNRLAVTGAIVMVQQCLKQYDCIPANGLAIYCGIVPTDEDQDEKIILDFEPLKSFSESLYICGKIFHIDPLIEQLKDDIKYGFIVVDGNGYLIGTVQGNEQHIVKKASVDLPKKHIRGGASAMRFARQRQEKWKKYLEEVARISVQIFVDDNVTDVVLAGCASIKTDLIESDMFTPLKNKVIKVIDVAYGGEQGFIQTVELTAGFLENHQENETIERYFEKVSMDPTQVLYGVDAVMRVFESGTLHSLIVWEKLDKITRFSLKNNINGDTKVLYLDPTQEMDKTNFIDNTTAAELEVLEKMPLIDWIVNNYVAFGVKLDIISDKSDKGHQFVNDFDGIAGILQDKTDPLQCEEDIILDGFVIVDYPFAEDIDQINN